jgi:predicted unusual protein kinase regulating ubiquinone biosynthesis (AarF/ABC1/UbiB family)
MIMMGSALARLLEFSKKHSEQVIATLLGIIIVGSIGGGLWIKSLQSTLAEREALTEERLELIEERYRTNFYALSKRVNDVETQLAQLVETFEGLEPTLINVSQRLSEMSSDQQLPDYHRTALATMSDEVSAAANDVRSAIDELSASTQELASKVEPFEGFGIPTGLTGTVFAVFGLGGLFYIWRHLRNTYTAKQERNQSDGRGDG